MDYSLENLEDQLIECLKADTDLYPTCTIRTYAGELSGLIFDDPTKMQGELIEPPFILIEYNKKKTTTKSSTFSVLNHAITFRFYVGAQSLRATSESALSCYSILRSIFDDIHGKFFNYTGATGSASTNNIGGTAISLNSNQQQQPFKEVDGDNEGPLFVLPKLAVYVTHYDCQLLTG